MGGEGGAAGVAGAGGIVGFGFTIGTGIGATGGGDVVVDGSVGGAGVEGAIAGLMVGPGVGFIEGGGAGFAKGGGPFGVEDVFGIPGGFAGAGAGVGESFSLSLESRMFGDIVGCCGIDDGVAGGTDGEALFVGLPRAMGAGTIELGVGPVPRPGDVGAAGDVGAGIGLALESDGFIGGSRPPMGTIVGDGRGFAGGCFFDSRDGDSVGDMVFVSSFGVDGAGLLFPADPPEYLPHSPAPSTCGKVGFGSTGADGEREGLIAGLVLFPVGFFLASDASIIEGIGEGEG